MLGEPLRQGIGAPLGQDLDGTAALDVDQDRAVVVALAKGEIVDAEHPDPSGGRVRMRADQAYLDVPAGPDRQVLGEPGTGPATQRQGDGLANRP
ncbi:hypothetical protein [Streptomyces sp. 1331.2]|uniref:hypothetical protein n=1 Tax=Streptomyces sp. 1331.2 TaxID=1938835 RepID=UPI000BE2AA55|nr:hypothetical protein [Streptomyces sp. 1331.2]